MPATKTILINKSCKFDKSFLPPTLPQKFLYFASILTRFRQASFMRKHTSVSPAITLAFLFCLFASACSQNNNIPFPQLLYLIAVIVLIRTLMQYRSRKLKQENARLEENVRQQTNELQKSLQDLKDTQAQLIQSEKMASLGELTAGIAHEIQNPLNFINNFSDVNKELIEELRTELTSGNTEEAILISADIKDNEERINHHGKRADAIVKGMLQHSRNNAGEKEPTDINALADEYLRLSYHGFRGKDNTFNASFKTDFDTNLKKATVVPQDLGRVLLNLINNAFYAVNDKKKAAVAKGEKYDPTVWIATKNISTLSKEGAGMIEILVRDNGNGIPRSVLEKIYQPFFTTKPSGQGTGLGLSLSYDIITAHGGEIKVETKEGDGTAFIIVLPVANVNHPATIAT
jgi:signal transduction histidine kinase